MTRADSFLIHHLYDDAARYRHNLCPFITIEINRVVHSSSTMVTRTTKTLRANPYLTLFST